MIGENYEGKTRVSQPAVHNEWTRGLYFGGVVEKVEEGKRRVRHLNLDPDWSGNGANVFYETNRVVRPRSEMQLVHNSPKRSFTAGTQPSQFHYPVHEEGVDVLGGQAHTELAKLHCTI